MATSEYNMVLNWTDPSIPFSDMEVVLKNFSESLKLVRLDKGKSGNTAVLLVLPKTEVSLDDLISKLQEINKDLGCSFFEAKTNW